MRRLSVVVALGCVWPAVAGADVSPNLSRGFSAEAFALGDLDHVNVLNGNAVVTIPLGSFPLSESFSYSFSLVYNSNGWEWYDYAPGSEVYAQSRPARWANAGFGWMVNLGRLFSPGQFPNSSGLWNYISPDGAEHVLYDKLRPLDAEDAGDSGSSGSATQHVLYARDGSYLRLRADPREIEFPNGQIHTFDSQGRLVQMRDRHLDAGGNPANYVNVNYTSQPGTWLVTDSHGRLHTFTTRSNAAYDVPLMIDSLQLAAFNNTTATYTFLYDEPKTIPRACPHVPDVDGLPATAVVPFLKRVILPDLSTYEIPFAAYDVTGTTFGCKAVGVMTNLTLPTLGQIGWTYQSYKFPADAVACSGRCQARSASVGVRDRMLKDATGAVLGTWYYTPALYPSDLGAEAKYAIRAVVTPLGDRTEQFFSVALYDGGVEGWLESDYALPFTRTESSGGRFLSTRVSDCAVNIADPRSPLNCTAQRSTYVNYAQDTYGSFGDTTLWPNTNRRVTAQRTVFHDDGGKYTDQSHSSFDGLGHHQQSSFQASFGAGDARTSCTNFNSAASSCPGAVSPMPTPAQPWLLERFNEQRTTEAGVTARSQFCFNSATGFLERKRTLKAGTLPGQNDLLTRFTSGGGNVVLAEYFGGDAQPLSTSADLCAIGLPTAEYAVQRDFTGGCGVLRKAHYLQPNGTPVGFESEDYDIDCNTGRQKASRDTAGLQTNFEYDALGRLTFAKPQANEGAWTENVYTRATSSTALARVTTYQRPNGGGAALAESAVQFDALGRVTKEERRMPSSGLVGRTTKYDAMGWKDTVSEMGVTAFVTKYLNYDPFGRPAIIRPPDGGGHDITLEYRGTREVKRTVKVGTSWDSIIGIGETNATTTETYDAQGRLSQVVEPSGATGGNTTTTYTYDVGSRLASASTTSGATQIRAFSYDNLGLLRFENHPEKTANIFGAGHDVDYVSYDARGHLLQKVDGTNDLRFSYDDAERLLDIRAAGGALLKEFTYSTGGAGWSKGKLRTATRHNRFSLCNVAHDAAIEETYTYSGLGGRVSQRDTKLRFDSVLGESFVQTFSWTQLGLPDTVGYPTCAAGFTDCTPALPGRTVKFGYSQGLLNTVGLVNNVTAYATSIGYHDNGMVSTVAHSNGVTDTQTLDPSKMARPLAISAALGGTTLWSSGDYAYDGAGNVTRTGGGYYVYDGVSRLREGKVFLGPEGAAGGFKIQRPGYDAFGNIQTLSLQTGNTTPVPRDVATTSSTNRLSAGTYDAAGNLTSASGQTYEYDAFNQAHRITIAGGQDWLHFYTADDERVWSYQLGGGPFNRWTLRDLGGNVLREAVSDNAGWRVERDYVYRDGSLLASDTPTPLSVRHFHLDHLGTPRAISDVNGARVAYHLYLPFGEEASAFDQDAERKKFTGHERDAHSASDAGDDLDYMHARHYSAVNGRFLSVDRASGARTRPQSWNRYSYALASPIKYLDPDGEAAVGFTGWSNSPGGGIEALITKLNGHPAIGNAQLFRYQNVRAAVHFLANQARANPKQPTIIMGHSLGAGSAVQAARLLQQQGLSVALVLTIDPVRNQSVPSNVSTAINFFQATDSPGGGQLSAASSSTEVFNTGISGIGHTDLDDAVGQLEMVLKLILDEALRAQRAQDSVNSLAGSACFYHGTCSSLPSL